VGDRRPADGPEIQAGPSVEADEVLLLIDQGLGQDHLIDGVQPFLEPDHRVNLGGVVRVVALFEAPDQTQGEGVDPPDRLRDRLGGEGPHVLEPHQAGHVARQVVGLFHAGKVVPQVLGRLVARAVLEDRVWESLSTRQGMG
jgi:hypothetical protein